MTHKKSKGVLLDVVLLAVGHAVAYEARAALVQIRVALDALETLGVPFEVGRNTQNVLIDDVATAAEADRHVLL
jgi:hypothetical protein